MHKIPYTAAYKKFFILKKSFVTDLLLLSVLPWAKVSATRSGSQGHIQPGLEHLQIQGIYRFSGQTLPLPESWI